MTFTITIACDNAAFADNGLAFEVANILREAADKVEGGSDEFALRDSNGNKVGSAEFFAE